MENNKYFNMQEKLDTIKYCYTNCINSFKEKPISPYEIECLYSCIDSRINAIIEVNNNNIKYNEFKNNIN